MAHTIDADLSGKHAMQLGPQGGRGPEQPKPERKRFDPKKIFLIAGLAALSWISTYSGMLELIVANLGELELMFKLAVAGSVAMLMLMVVWLLDQMFNRDHAGMVRVLYLSGYLFLSLISIGFSFGFYWKFLESRTEGTKLAEQAVVGVQTHLQAAETRLTQLQTTLESLALISTQKAESERLTGNSCPNSRPGDGPRRRLREADAASFATASQFVKDRAALIKKDIAAFGGDLEKIVKQDKSTFDPRTGTRTDYLKGVTRKLTMTVSGYDAFRSDPQLQQYRTDFADRAERTVFPDEQGKTFTCPDAQIQSALRGGVKAIDALPQITAPEIITVEGADATLEAFRRLIFTLTSPASLFSSRSEDIRAAQQRAMQSVGSQADAQIMPQIQMGLSKRDYIPLAIAIFVDLCLLLVSIPQATSAAQQARQRRANATGDTYRTLDDLYAIHDDEDTRGRLEPLRHIAFDWLGVDYVAVPVVAGAGALQNGKVKGRFGGLTSLFLTRDDEPEDLPRDDDDSEYARIAREKLVEDLKEAQFLANFFASHENKGPYRRAVFPRAATIKRRLARIGSKWAGIGTFRLYRFNRGAWSDFVLDVIVGADRELGPVRETQKRNALHKTLLKSKQLEQEAELMSVDHDSRIGMKRKEAEIKQRGAEQALQEMEQQLRGKEIDLRKQHLESERDVKKLEHELAQLDGDTDTGEETYPDGRREPWLSLNRLRGTRKSARTAQATQQPDKTIDTSPEITALLKGVSQLTLAMHYQQQQMADLMRSQQAGALSQSATANGHSIHAYGHGMPVGATNGHYQAGPLPHHGQGFHPANGNSQMHAYAQHGHTNVAQPHGMSYQAAPQATAPQWQAPMMAEAPVPTAGAPQGDPRSGTSPPSVIVLHSDRRGQEQPLQGQVLPPVTDGNTVLARQAGDKSSTSPAKKAEGGGLGTLLKSGLGGISELFKRAPQNQAPQGGVHSLDHEPIEPLVADAVAVDTLTTSATAGTPFAGAQPISEMQSRPALPPQAPAPSLLSTRAELDRFIREIEESTTRVAARIASPFPAGAAASRQPATPPMMEAAATAPDHAEHWSDEAMDFAPSDFGFDEDNRDGARVPADEQTGQGNANGGWVEPEMAPRQSSHRQRLDRGNGYAGPGRTEPHFAEPDDDAELTEIFGDASETIAIGDITKWYGKGRKKGTRRQ